MNGSTLRIVIHELIASKALNYEECPSLEYVEGNRGYIMISNVSIIINLLGCTARSKLFSGKRIFRMLKNQYIPTITSKLL